MGRSSGHGNNHRSISRASAPVRSGGHKTGPKGFAGSNGSLGAGGRNRVGRNSPFHPNNGSQAASVKGPRGAGRVGGVAIKSLNAQGPLHRGGVGLPRGVATGGAAPPRRAKG